ncbi:MAG TPA: DUF937 domain-containing protein [Ramlibacter sp.]
MQLTDLLQQAGGLDSIARELGIPAQQAASGAEALLPAILGGFQHKAEAQGGVAGLGGLLGRLGGGGLLDQVLSPQPTDVSQGDAVLGEIFGSREVSRTVAQSASAQSGLDPALLKKMLPLLAMAVAGFMAKRGTGTPDAGASAAGGLGGMLGSVFGGGSQASGGALGGLGSLLDANRDGNALDDILRMAGKAMR